MKKFNFTLSAIVEKDVVIEANNFEEAEHKAKQIFKEKFKDYKIEDCYGKC